MAGNDKKLNGELKATVWQMLASFFSPANIVEELKEKFDINVSIQAICYQRDKFKDEIAELRKAYLKDFEVVPISNKKVRMEMRQKLVDDLLGKLWYINSIAGKNVEIWRGNHDVINKLLDSAKNEMEPQKIAPTNPDGTEEYGSITEEEAVDRLLAVFNANGSFKSFADFASGQMDTPGKAKKGNGK